MAGNKYIRSLCFGEITEKKSRFIASLTPVKDETEALAFITAMKKKYYDARHNCSAYIVGDISKCSDDGEPAHTAGRPMMDVLVGNDLNNVCVVVTRYFGGVLLGTGGLVRAYKDAVIDAVNNADIYELSTKRELLVSCEYTDYGKFEHLAASEELLIDNINYTDKVSFTLYVEPEKLGYYTELFTNLTAGKCTLSEGDLVDI